MRTKAKARSLSTRCTTVGLVLASASLCCLPAAHAQDQPNIVLVFMASFGWGEPGFNGGEIVRGAATPRLDGLAAEGLRIRLPVQRPYLPSNGSSSPDPDERQVLAVTTNLRNVGLVCHREPPGLRSFVARSNDDTRHGDGPGV